MWKAILYVESLQKQSKSINKTESLMVDKLQLPKLPCKLIEHCIMCKQETPYLDSDPLHLRQFYLKSMGQCCSSCYMAIHNTSTTCDDFEEETYY